MAEYDGNGNLKYNYILGNGARYAWVNASGEKAFFIHDYLGTTRRITNENSDLIWSRDYYPFGGEGEAAGDGNMYKFTGQEFDSESNSYHFDYRQYDSELGKWFSPDPSFFLHPGLSPYTYVGNNPLRWKDLLGLDWVPGPDGKPMWRFEEPVIVTAKGTPRWKRVANNILDQYSKVHANPNGSGYTITTYRIRKPALSNAQMNFLGTTVPKGLTWFFTGMGGAALATTPAVEAAIATYGPQLAALELRTVQDVQTWMTTVGVARAQRYLYAVKASFLYYQPQIYQAAGSVGSAITGSPSGMYPTNRGLDYSLKISFGMYNKFKQ